MTSLAVSQNAELAVEFLRALVRDSRITLVAIPESDSPKACTFSRSDMDGLRAFIAAHNGVANIYFQVNPLRADVASRKAKKEHIAHAEVLHVDVDSPEGLDRIRGFSPPPSAVVFSGGGYHAYWLLKAPSNDLALVEQLNRALVDALDGDRSAIDVSRVLRVPHTVNLPNAKKRENGRMPVESTVVGDLTDFTRIYPIEQLHADLSEYVQLPAPTLTAVVQAQSVELDDDGLPRCLPEPTKLLAINGPLVGEHAYHSRSEGVWRFLCDCARMRVPIAVSVATLTNPKFAISKSILEKPKPAEYARRQSERAWDAIHSDFERTAGRQIRPTLRNTLLAISKLGIECWHDSFRRRRYIQGDAVKDLAGQVTDDAEIKLRATILKECGFDPTPNHVHYAVRALALENIRNVVAEYFSGLSWDGTPRLDDFLVDYCGADDTPLNKSIGPKVLIAAVRRARKPGTKFDTVMVLEGPQGCGKSSMLSILAGPENFSDQSILSVEPRAQMELVEGVLIYEIAELDGLTRTEANRVKAFLSRTDDRGRVAYGRNREEQPRTCVFIGTTNESHYLKDTTGNRRFWPVKVGQIDLQSIERDRDQLWAEAAAREADGEHITLEPELYAHATEAQEERVEIEPWEDLLRGEEGQLHGTERRIANGTVFAAIGLDPHNQKAHDVKRAAAVMKRLGWFGPKVIRFEGNATPKRGYWRPA